MFSTYFGSQVWNDLKTKKMEKERNLVIKNSNAAVIKAYPSFPNRKRKLLRIVLLNLILIRSNVNKDR